MVEKLNGIPEAYAEITGIDKYPDIHGRISFYEVYGGTVLMAEVYGLPDEDTKGVGKFFGFHVHEGSSCSGIKEEPLKHVGGHLNLQRTQHPFHTGDIPPLLSVSGAAWMTVYTGRFYPEDVLGRTVIIHQNPDDFHTQPSGNSGEMIACGEIKDREGIFNQNEF